MSLKPPGATARADAWTEFFSLDTWRAACAECGVDMEGIAQGQYETSWVTPWDHLSVGVTTRFFRRERRLAQEERTTPDCSYERCSACGVCPKLNIDIQCQEERHG